MRRDERGHHGDHRVFVYAIILILRKVWMRIGILVGKYR